MFKSSFGFLSLSVINLWARCSHLNICVKNMCPKPLEEDPSGPLVFGQPNHTICARTQRLIGVKVISLHHSIGIWIQTALEAIPRLPKNSRKQPVWQTLSGCVQNIPKCIKAIPQVMHQPVFSDYRFVVSLTLNRPNQPRGCQFGSLSRKACKCNFGKRDWRSLAFKLLYNLPSRRTENPQYSREACKGMFDVWECISQRKRCNSEASCSFYISLSIQTAFTCVDHVSKNLQQWGRLKICIQAYSQIYAYKYHTLPKTRPLPPLFDLH